MYIAFKWLVVLTLGMWIFLCWSDQLQKTNKYSSADFIEDLSSETVYENTTLIEQAMNEQKSQDKPIKNEFIVQNVALLHYLMFFAGGLAVMVFNRKSEIITYTRRKIFKINHIVLLKYFRVIHNLQSKNLKKTATDIRVAILKKVQIFGEKLKRVVSIYQSRHKKEQDRNNLNFVLLKKIKEVGEERNDLAQLLIAAVQANKNIRMQYQLETMAKNRLVRHIENTQKQIKENRSRYVNFQQLYVITHQENIFLKARVKKLTSEKEHAERSLMNLVTKMYDSTDSDLKACCSRFLVQSKDYLLNSDVNEDIHKLLKRPREPTACSSNRQLNCESIILLNLTKSWSSTRRTRVMPHDHEENLMLVKANAPKLRGLPGEYIWTVKDKNGMIEKLYEYESGYDFGDNLDTIRRIRQYSVYHDKDCLLDFSNSRTIIPDTNTVSAPSQCPAHYIDFPTRQRFLTGSEAFQTFLKNNNNLVASTPAPPVICV